MEKFHDFIKGRGAQINPPNPYHSNLLDTEEDDGIDIPMDSPESTQIFLEHPKKILNKITSPDLPMAYTLNPYQGCEHGCIYCYARNAHQYYGFSAGLDFEQKIIVKENAHELLKEALEAKSWKGETISFSGNTDCYQPLERKFEITRSCLKVCLEYSQSVGIITKNSLILRDLDILKAMASKNLVAVYITITTLDKDLRLTMEPRTATAQKRLDVLAKLSSAGIPCGVMIGPVIPGLNNHEIPQIMEKASAAGALSAGYNMVRLNGSIGVIFEDWIQTHYPDKADKVLNQIKACHAGKLNDSVYGRRMRGSGEIADSISQFFKLSKAKHFGDKKMPSVDKSVFKRPRDNQLSLF